MINVIMKNIKKYLSKKIFIAILIVAGFIFFGTFIVDLGVNSKYFIKKDFNSAFNYRVTGDCVAFAKFINNDIDKWKSACEEEKSRQSEPIRYYKIQAISYSLGSDRAFLQVELKRNNNAGTSDVTYSAQYELKKTGFVWKIDQEKF